MVLQNFDFSEVNSKDFKEDSVRELIITPILDALGYSSNGKYKVSRSKALIHPFWYLGTSKRKINIVPDYVLNINDIPLVVIDAKSPKENILNGPNVEQTFSYAMHQEIRAKMYGLCNGKSLTIFNVSIYNPIAVIDLTNINMAWKEIEKYLLPKNVEFPHLSDFKPDLGLFMFKSGIPKDFIFEFPGVYLEHMAKLSDNEYCCSCNIQLNGESFSTTFDMDYESFIDLMDCLNHQISHEIKDSLSKQPFQTSFKDNKHPCVDIKAILTRHIQKGVITSEEFLPFNIIEISKSQFDFNWARNSLNL